jgi:hypothetical protein
MVDIPLPVSRWKVCIKTWVPSLLWQCYGWAHVPGTFLLCHIGQFLLVDNNHDIMLGRDWLTVRGASSRQGLSEFRDNGA